MEERAGMKRWWRRFVEAILDVYWDSYDKLKDKR